MSRKDYVIIAAVLKSLRDQGGRITTAEAAADFAAAKFSEILKSDNPRFNPDKFRAATK